MEATLLKGPVVPSVMRMRMNVQFYYVGIGDSAAGGPRNEIWVVT